MKSLPKLNDLEGLTSKSKGKIRFIYRRALFLKRLQEDIKLKNRALIRKELGALIWLLDDAGVFESPPVELNDFIRRGDEDVKQALRSV